MNDRDYIAMTEMSEVKQAADTCGVPCSVILQAYESTGTNNRLFIYSWVQMRASDALDINRMVADCHNRSRNAGWYHDPITGMPLNRNVGEMLCLIHSEVSEAMEGYRKDLMDDKLPNRKQIEVELADTIIRINDLAGYLKLDLGGAYIEKLAYNASREDHKPENRAKAGGKAF